MKRLIGAVFASADLLGLLEIESEEKTDVQALAADAATYRELKEQQARKVTGTEARCTKVI